LRLFKVRGAQELLKNLPEGTHLDDHLLQAVTSQGLVRPGKLLLVPLTACCFSSLLAAWHLQVENIALLNNARDLGYVGVNMYVDDDGSIKDAPVNARASELAACCGKPMQVRGDAFIGRIFDNEDEFRRLDFAISEMSSTAGWVKEAARRNGEAAKRAPGGLLYTDERR